MKTLKEVLIKSEEFLRKKNIEKPRLESQIIFSQVLNLKRYELYIYDEKPLTDEEINLLRDMVIQKSKNIPTAYLFHKKDFFHEEFYVDENVLIPRPETEELVERIIASVNKKTKTYLENHVDCSNHQDNLTILDLCSGSGCIGISLKKQFTNSNVFFSDINAKTLEITKKNYLSIIKTELTSENIFLSNLFENISSEYNDYFSLIVTNPPYITKNEYEKLDANVKEFEPEVALLVDEPNFFFNKLFQGAYEKLKSGGCIFCETNPTLIQEQKLLLKNLNFQDIIIIKDISNKERFLFARK